MKMSPGSYSLRPCVVAFEAGQTEEAEAQIDQAISDAERKMKIPSL